jgi:SAM-dependent methyltransferase
VEGNDGGLLHRSLIHGNTIHGRENSGSLKPLTYYYPTGPIGQVFLEWASKKPTAQIGLVGLGVGSLAYYGLPGQTMTYYEIDPAVIKIARDPNLFTFISSSKIPIEIVEGDARLTLITETRKFDLLVLDAFTSDSVPLHLLTIEAMKLYASLLKPGGIIAFHISNRYLSLKEILAAAAQHYGMNAVLREDQTLTSEEEREGKTRSQWMLIYKSLEDLGTIKRDASWFRMVPEPGVQPWRDDFSNLLEAMLRNRDPY